MNKKTLFFGVFCATSIFGFAQQLTDSTQVEQLDEVVITDSKFNLKRENSGKVITKISHEDLQHLQGKTIAEIINTTAGIEINGSKSNAGQNLNYYIRGGRNRQVLILIDGVALTDPSQIANDYDLRLLNPDQVESIEILKGASSTLYGSGAATAVINIKLKEASKSAISADFKSVFGTNQSQNDSDYAIEDFRNSISVNGTLGNFNYLASFGNQFTDGLSALEAGIESDAYNAINGNLKLGYQFLNQFKMHAYASFDRFKAEFDDASTFTDANNYSISKQYRVGIAPEFSYKKGSITLNAAYNDVQRVVASGYPAEYTATSLVADMLNRYHFNNKFYTILGVNFQESDMESYLIPFGSTNLEQSIDPETATFSILDPYVNVVYVSKFGLNVNAGVRLNNHSEYGSHLVYSLNPSFIKKFNFGYLKGMASYSTAYITPSLYQLYEPAYGNADLKPEENETIEVSIEAGIKDKATLSLVYFTRNETNFIDFVDMGNFVYQYNNVDDDFTASGLEFVANYNITKTLRINANVTYTQVEDHLNLRIPEFKGNAQLDYNLFQNTFLSLAYQYTADRHDAYFNNATFETEDVILKSYNILDFYVSHTILDGRLKLFANVNNILNEEYQELYGYSARGRNVNIGFNLSL
ncbi:TonB-dependent receptor [Hanstruepera neustonica]|uniref:TonB-dependent receptor n=1 Tax=Hanstruepera neustonica TaxID=1445657 RepID=A0A2K1DWL6_9FLAO|nr:TonB-dependent receptor plug domain-containing protein [Hanstruepera neustonica]PNQ72427.1 TonB-dependent receptor [Hanstruepera neustonica]